MFPLFYFSAADLMICERIVMQICYASYVIIYNKISLLHSWQCFKQFPVGKKKETASERQKFFSSLQDSHLYVSLCTFISHIHYICIYVYISVYICIYYIHLFIYTHYYYGNFLYRISIENLKKCNLLFFSNRCFLKCVQVHKIKLFLIIRKFVVFFYVKFH